VAFADVPRDLGFFITGAVGRFRGHGSPASRHARDRCGGETGVAAVALWYGFSLRLTHLRAHDRRGQGDRVSVVGVHSACASLLSYLCARRSTSMASGQVPCGKQVRSLHTTSRAHRRPLRLAIWEGECSRWRSSPLRPPWRCRLCVCGATSRGDFDLSG
jgi:hypothetical protein